MLSVSLNKTFPSFLLNETFFIFSFIHDEWFTRSHTGGSHGNHQLDAGHYEGLHGENYNHDRPGLAGTKPSPAKPSEGSPSSHTCPHVSLLMSLCKSFDIPVYVFWCSCISLLMSLCMSFDVPVYVLVSLCKSFGVSV